jgi:putative ABC transport system permease protein
MTSKIMQGEKLESPEQTSYTYDEILEIEFKLILNTDYYQKQNNTWINKSTDEQYMKQIIDNGLTLKVVGIMKPNEESSNQTSGEIGYVKELKEYVISEINKSEIA